MKGKDGIGDYINKKVLAPIDRENGFDMLSKIADFNDEGKISLGDSISGSYSFVENNIFDFDFDFDVLALE